jgi:hypothetical protein
LINVREDLAKIVRHTPDFVIAQFQIGEIRHISDLCVSEVQTLRISRRCLLS